MKTVSLLFGLLLFCASKVSASTVFPFELRWMNADSADAVYRTSDHADGIFVLEVYFQSCPDCNNNAPNVHALASEYAGHSRVQVLDVSRDTRASDYQSWISRHRPNHPVLNDSSRSVINKLQPPEYPATYILNCRGEIVYRTSNVWSSLTKQEMRTTINHMLEREC